MRGCLAFRLLIFACCICYSCFRYGQGNTALHCACSGPIRHFALRFAPGMSRCFILCFLPSFESALHAVMRDILHRVVYLAPLSVCVFPVAEGSMQYGLSAFLVLFTHSCKKTPYFRRFPSIYLIKRNGNLKCKFTFFEFHFSVREISQSVSLCKK